MTSEQKTTQQDVFRINSAELAARTVTGLALCFGAAVAFKFSMAAAFHVDAFLTFTECIQWLAPFGLIVALTTLAIYRRNYTLIVSSPSWPCTAR